MIVVKPGTQSRAWLHYDQSMSGYYWCLRHNRVETDADKCDESKLLGPFQTSTEATEALQKVQQRNEAWEAEDERWHGERD